MEKEQEAPENPKISEEAVAAIVAAICACGPENSVPNKMAGWGPPLWRLAGMIAANRFPERRRS